MEDDGFLKKFLAIRDQVALVRRVVLINGEPPNDWVVS